MPHYRLHDLRSHTYFTRCTELDFSDPSITAIGGCSSIQSTNGINNAAMESMRSDMAKLDDAFESVKEKV